MQNTMSEDKEHLDINKRESELFCPNCGFYPVNLSYEKVDLTLKVAGKVWCPNCTFEEIL